MALFCVCDNANLRWYQRACIMIVVLIIMDDIKNTLIYISNRILHSNNKIVLKTHKKIRLIDFSVAKMRIPIRGR